MTTIPVSVIVITKNEHHNLRACLETVKWVDEILVVDAESEDDTVDIAREFTGNVHVRPWEGYAAAKTFAVAQARHEWVLWLDADERVPEELASEIRTLLSGEPAHDAYRVARRAYFLGRWIRHCGWYPGYVTRLFRKSRGGFSDALVHESLEVDGSVGTLRHALLHYTDRDLEHYFSKFNRYTSLAAEDLRNRGRRANLLDLLLRPPFAFLKMYIIRLGVLDGMEGFILSRLSASYVFAKYAKLWHARRRGEADPP